MFFFVHDAEYLLQLVQPLDERFVGEQADRLNVCAFKECVKSRDILHHFRCPDFRREQLLQGGLRGSTQHGGTAVV